MDKKIWLGVISNDKEYINLDELTKDIWQDFDGLAMIIHNQYGKFSEIENLLLPRIKDGFIIKRDYLYHNGHSMNEFLFNPKIQLGDWIILRDSNERLNPYFSKDLRNFISFLESKNINSVYQHSKLLMFRRWFNQQFVNGLHWGLLGAQPMGISIENFEEFALDENCAFSLRNKNRPKEHRFLHEARYLINYGANGNHLQLFWPIHDQLEVHQNEFYKFLQYLDELKIKDVDLWGKYLQNNTLTEKMKYHINLERPLRNYYRYYVLKHSNEEILKDEDTWRIQ